MPSSGTGAFFTAPVSISGATSPAARPPLPFASVTPGVDAP